MKVEFFFNSVHIKKFYNQKELFDISHRCRTGESFDAHYDTDYDAVSLQRFKINPSTAEIELSTFVLILALLKQKRDFKKLEFSSHYEKTPKEVMELVNKKIKNL